MDQIHLQIWIFVKIMSQWKKKNLDSDVLCFVITWNLFRETNKWSILIYINSLKTTGSWCFASRPIPVDRFQSEPVPSCWFSLFVCPDFGYCCAGVNVSHRPTNTTTVNPQQNVSAWRVPLHCVNVTTVLMSHREEGGVCQNIKSLSKHRSLCARTLSHRPVPGNGKADPLGGKCAGAVCVFVLTWDLRVSLKHF